MNLMCATILRGTHGSKTHRYTRIHTHTRKYIHVWIIYMLRIFFDIHVHLYVYTMHTQTHTNIQTQTRTHAHTHTQSHTHTHTQSHSRFLKVIVYTLLGFKMGALNISLSKSATHTHVHIHTHTHTYTNTPIHTNTHIPTTSNEVGALIIALFHTNRRPRGVRGNVVEGKCSCPQSNHNCPQEPRILNQPFS